MNEGKGELEMRLAEAILYAEHDGRSFILLPVESAKDISRLLAGDTVEGAGNASRSNG